MTRDDRFSLFCGKLADNAKELGLSAFEHDFAENNRFTFNFSPRMKKVMLGLIARYGEKMGWKD